MDDLFQIKKQNTRITDDLYGDSGGGEMKPVKVITDNTFLDQLSSVDTVVDVTRLPLPSKSYSIRFIGVLDRTLFILKSIDICMCQIVKPDSSKMIEFRCLLSNEQKNMLENLSRIEILENSFPVKSLFINRELIERTFSTNTLVFRVFL